MYDFGRADFSASPAARSLVHAANPLSPGGLNPRNTSIPTLVWAVLFLLAALFLYHTLIKRR